MALYAQLALCELHKWHCMDNWPCLHKWHCIDCSVCIDHLLDGIVYSNSMAWVAQIVTMNYQIVNYLCLLSDMGTKYSQLPLFACRYGDQIGTLIGIANYVPEMVLVEEADNSNEV